MGLSWDQAAALGEEILTNGVSTTAEKVIESRTGGQTVARTAGADKTAAPVGQPSVETSTASKLPLMIGGGAVLALGLLVLLAIKR